MNSKTAFDFDGIFIGNPPLIPKEIVEKLYKKKNHTLSYRVPGKLEQKIRILSHFPIFRPPIDRNLLALPEIANKNPDIHIISSRFSFLKKRTEVLIEKYDIAKYFKSINFNFEDKQPHIFKDELIKKLKIGRMVDDDPDLIRYLSKKNPKVEFFFLSRKKDENIPPKIKQIKNLEEFFENYV